MGSLVGPLVVAKQHVLLSVDMNGMDFVKIAVSDVDLKTSYSIVIHICHQ
jgi:hypothetical protein